MNTIDKPNENLDNLVDSENQSDDLFSETAPDSFANVDFDAIEAQILKLQLAQTGEDLLVPEKAEVIIGREDPINAIFPDIDTTLYGGEESGVSRRHAKIVHQGNDYLVEDLNSVNRTFLNKTILEPGNPVPLSDGDELMLGRLKFSVIFS